jgi:hypothetical protein
MTISDETLMAYADGELDAAAREAVESAMREDPRIEERVARHRALRLQVQAAYSAELLEDVPESLLSAARGAASTPGARVVNLRAAAAALDREAGRARLPRRRWRTAGAMAASVIAGVGLGFFIWGRTALPLVRSADGAFIARGWLATALSDQLTAEQSRNSAVQIGLSFLAKSGDYCRTFALPGKAPPSGLACRHGGQWQIRALTEGPEGSDASEYRTAGSTTPAAILELVEGQISGAPLDREGERVARQRGWKPADR